MKKVLQVLLSNRDIIFSSFFEENKQLADGVGVAEKFIISFTQFIKTGQKSQDADPFIQILFRMIEQALLDLPQAARLVSNLRNVLFDLLNQHLPYETQALQQLNHYLDEVIEKVAIKFDHIIKEQTTQIETLQNRNVNFISKRKRGWLDVDGTRMCMLDISDGWFNIWLSMVLFAGEDTAKRVFFEVGLSEAFSRNSLEKGVLNNTIESFVAAVDTYSEAGFGNFQIKALSFEKGYARITCPDTFEGWAFLKKNKTVSSPCCYFSSGVLLSFMKTISNQPDLISEEVKCIAKGDSECEFVIGTEKELVKRGIRLTVWGPTLKEKAKSLETLLYKKELAEKELIRKNEELLIINRIGRDISQSLNLDTILNRAINNLSRIVGNQGIGIYLVDRKNNELVFTAHKGFSKKFFKLVSRLRIGEGLAGNVATRQVPMAYDDYTKFPQHIDDVAKKEKIKSLLSVPLKTKNKILGVLNISTKKPYHFTVEEINLISLIGNQIGVAIENARLLEKVKESEKKYKTLVEDINDGYFLCQDNQVLYTNSAFLSMHGYDKLEVIGNDFRKFLSEQTVTHVENILSGRSKRNEIPEHLEFLRKHRNGKKLPTELKINLVEFNGKPSVIAIFRDISIRKEMEQKVIENQRLASIGQLTADIAHEIRNPLSSIKTNIQVLSNKLHLQGFNKRRMEIAVEEILRLDQILQDVLNFSVPVKMQMSLDHLHNIIDRCIGLIHEKIKKTNINVIQKLSGDLPKIKMNTGMIQQVVLNIFLNAIAAMPDGGHIIIMTQNIPAEDGQMIRLEVMDSGCGIAKDNLKRVFDPFFSTKTQGAGLGLSNVKKIIDAHHGKIEIDSRINQGTSIIITLPGDKKNDENSHC